jgi:hypothetical protein
LTARNANSNIGSTHLRMTLPRNLADAKIVDAAVEQKAPHKQKTP